MRNRLIFILAIFMSLGLVGCGQESSSDAADPAKTAASPVTDVQQPAPVAATDSSTPAVIAPTATANAVVTAPATMPTASAPSSATPPPPPAQASPSDLANTGVVLPPSPTSGAAASTTAVIPGPALPVAPTATVPAAPAVQAVAPVVNGGANVENKVATPIVVPPTDNTVVKAPVIMPGSMPSDNTQAPVTMKNPADTKSSTGIDTSSTDNNPDLGENAPVDQD